ncbi:MAG TPA: NRDE family protein [Streptosporangiaceae bacterium]|nr:NRDE family protein [Streptosporangiaceae bacterium]
MCTALLSIEPGRPTLLVGVRDELADRPWELPGPHWPEWPELLGGKDLQAGGTWLAVSPRERRAATVLNGRGQPAPAAARQSRGALPLQAAAGKPLDRGTVANADPFHLITVEIDGALVQSWDGYSLTERELGPGLYFTVNSGFSDELLPAAGPHELGRIRHFLPRFRAASRPEPEPGLPVAAAWGEWLTLVNGDGIGSHDERALIVERDLGGGRTFATTSVSLVALSPDWLRYDFTARPGHLDAWYPVRVSPSS